MEDTKVAIDGGLGGMWVEEVDLEKGDAGGTVDWCG